MNPYNCASFAHLTNMAMEQARRVVGFTLIELLMAVAVLAILLALAAPNFADMVVAGKLEAHANSFLSAVHLARTEAIKRNARVVLCKSESGSSCDASGGWEKGWLVFHDVNNNASVDEGEMLIQRQQALSTNFILTGNDPVSKYISYTPIGAAKLTSGAFQVGTVTLCRLSSYDGEARQVIINITGRPRVEKTIVASCM